MRSFQTLFHPLMIFPECFGNSSFPGDTPISMQACLWVNPQDNYRHKGGCLVHGFARGERRNVRSM